jgi:hypothetical protein
MDNQSRKQLQGLMQDVRWGAVERFIDFYLKKNFLQDGAKKDTEFDTLWYLAFAEGGKHHAQRVLVELEEEARKAE